MALLTPQFQSQWRVTDVGRRASVEYLESNLTLLSHHAPLRVRNSRSKRGRNGDPKCERSIAKRSDENPDLSPPQRPHTLMVHEEEGDDVEDQLVPLPTYYPNQYSVCSQADVMVSSEPSPKCAGISPVIPTITATSPLTTLSSSVKVARSPASNVGTGPSVVAIDNKIEQAMDLVKTHLTYAVREEVDILRTTITELEEKVTQLENQNQVLKQFAPPEVLANLSFLVQNAQAQKQLQQQAQQLISPVPSQPQLLPLSSQPLSTASVITALPKPTALNTSQVNATSATQQSMPLSKSPPTDLARTVEQSMVTTAGDGYFSVLSPSSTPSLASATVADPSISYVSPSNLSAAEAANTVNSAIP
ncbi:hypothetical protein AB6A40_000398 [Gnathostoma spinigerum]|uniref:TSC22 domain family protein 1 n=1 Tax=Gnathostoma spinigerum TaxID=75299 RepID=A0ABD6E6D2_9BILA